LGWLPGSRFPKRSPKILFLYLLIFFFSLSESGPETFTNVFLVEVLGAGNDLIGLVGAVLWLVPIIGFYAADRLIKRIGYTLTMATSFALFAVAWSGYALIHRPFSALLFVSFQGFAQALYLISLFILLSEFGFPARASTDLMLAQMTIPGLAKILAQPASGWIYSRFGGRVLFTLDVVIVLITMVLLLSTRRAFQNDEEGVEHGG
jgi:predicted MFS family arabinose efflux permease